MIYYLMICTATVLFGMQFFFNQSYTRKEGDSLGKALIFSLLTSLVIGIVMLLLKRGQVEYTWFSLVMASLTAVCCVLFLVFSAVALNRVDLSVFSLYSMMGGMLLPFLAGVLFFDETFTLKKLICILVIALAVWLSMDLKNTSGKVSGCCLGAFAMNGLVGVIAKWHQSTALPIVSSEGFMLLRSIVMVVICAVALLLWFRKSAKLQSGKAVAGAVIGYGLMEGLGNLLLLIALTQVNASVQYPMVTGGTILVCAVVDMLRGIKLSRRTVISCALAFLATLMIM